MRQFIKILTLAILITSCGQTDTKQKELELKEKELALKQKELDLKEKELKNDSLGIQPQKPADNLSANTSGSYIITADKSYFFNSADLKTIRKGYLLKGDEVEVKKVEGNFAYSSYTSPSGSQINGWLLLSELQKSSNTASNSTVDYKKFVGKWKTSSDNEIEFYYIDYANGQFSISIDWSKAFTDEMEKDNHMNILSNCANYIGKLKNGVLKAKHTERSSCDDEPEIILKGDNQIIVSSQVDKTKVIYTRQ